MFSQTDSGEIPVTHKSRWAGGKDALWFPLYFLANVSDQKELQKLPEQQRKPHTAPSPTGGCGGRSGCRRQARGIAEAEPRCAAAGSQAVLSSGFCRL